MNPVIDRPRIVAEPSRVPGAGAVLTPDALDLVAELDQALLHVGEGGALALVRFADLAGDMLQRIAELGRGAALHGNPAPSLLARGGRVVADGGWHGGSLGARRRKTVATRERPALPEGDRSSIGSASIWPAKRRVVSSKTRHQLENSWNEGRNRS